MINVSGHRIGTAEVESALVGHSHCSEAAVVGIGASAVLPFHCSLQGRYVNVRPEKPAVWKTLLLLSTAAVCVAGKARLEADVHPTDSW